MLETFLKVGGRKGLMDFDELGVQDVVELLRSDVTDIPAILADFGNRTRGEDPVIHFYEHFLGAYNKQLKIQRGVFYTPQPVVSYIVRSVHELLQTDFGLEDGLADTTTWSEFIQKSKLNNPQSTISLPPLTDQPGETRTISPDEPLVQILDPATGTATFLVEVIDVIHGHLKERWRLADSSKLPGGDPRFKTFKEYWNHYVPKHLLPRLHGYELMMAPYAIAHMKIGLKLTELGYEFNSDARAQIYLTNALEYPDDNQAKLIGFDALAHEAEEVNKIKRYKRFTVITGNPPYTVMSANLSDASRALIEAYRFADGERLKEKSMLRLEMHLQDDYIKFFRISEQSICTAGMGILGLISNHSFLNNPTLRGMRWNLLQTFSSLQVLDLHGSPGRRHATATGSDENVFDILQGVAISLMAKVPSQATGSRLLRADLIGERTAKYRALAESTAQSTQYQTVDFCSPFYLFTVQDVELRSEYNSGASLVSAMPTNSVGIVTGRDGFATDITEQALHDRIEMFCDISRKDPEVRALFGIRDAGGYALSKRRKFVVGKPARDFIKKVTYRPFDFRWIAYSRGFLTSDQRNVMRHILPGGNLALVTARSNKSDSMNHFFCSTNITETKCGESTTQSCVFPLYTIPDDGLALPEGPCSNFSTDFLRDFASRLNLSIHSSTGLPAGLTPEDIFHYIYSIFHSPRYRTRYAEFLKIDFPRLPLTGNLELFRKLAYLGCELTALHLLESPKLDQSITEFVGSSQEITKVGYTDHTVWINAGGTKGKNTPGSSGFCGVPEAVWNFHIGGYQVCEKWLKDRKGRTLTAEDIAHYHKIVVALSETLRLMAEIDGVIEAHGGWPGAFQSKEA
jgi:predicted helicase